MRLPSTTYRIQLRAGVTFETVEGLLPYLDDLGVSDLYLSPIFRAGTGSTHGYDVIDPTEIEPELGGRESFARLARAARERGMGVILDIVPNHTAFSPENPWLREVLRHGRESRYARHFDIDWSKGRLILPFLAAPFETRLAEGAIAVAEAADGPVLTDGPLEIPLRPGSVPDDLDPPALRKLHASQPWRLADWRLERDGITHRRFFNITGLIGMRIEEPEVFEDMHRLTFDLVDEGFVTALRVDHVDGLADPTGYLRRLRERVGDRPIWVEKILVGDEDLPEEWPVEGTTGYEAARAIAQVLTDDEGLVRLDSAWRQTTGRTGSFMQTLRQAKGEVLRNELAAELHQLIGLAQRAADRAPHVEVGPEFLREAIGALLVAFPRYRTYFDKDPAREEDASLWEAVVAEAVERPRSDAAIRFLAEVVRNPKTKEEVAFRARFQQVTGALLAKAHEDTASFRYNRYLAANEVGAEPDHATLDAGGFDWRLQKRLRVQPAGLTLTSSHDTKRSEDARMRLVAISHFPEDFVTLYRDASSRVPGASDVSANFRWYLCQSLLAIWDEASTDLGDRLADHAEKALREAKRITFWTDPVEEAETPALDWARALAADWGRHLPTAATSIMERGRALSEIQLALKMTMPGIPDIYQGAEAGHHFLTDPDNRRPVDFDRLARLAGEDGADGRKARLTRKLAWLRRDEAEFFAKAEAHFERAAEMRWTMRRVAGDRTLVVTMDVSGAAPPDDGAIWPGEQDRSESSVSMHWE
ncbi:malto-oligosyltrehalose synthase [Roseitranquillus sediminis]|uniref:malto-oligosyltrehalose synthase n=1 Tax=Roseitranquillus sediminis TaxID=2809051 RepID=UPI001D0C12D4|nr:malto-oligosyltrehalose synthase [Roseitranquillus sediminis]MBM9595726.1 malto-oligosyltrehalose synthase [Roseitranquillus sediminis]